MEKTLSRVRNEAYWVNMAQDVEVYCRQCTQCQQAKLPAPIRVPLTSLPIGRPWQMVAADILEVPVSYRNSRYLLVMQDYFTKWPEAIPLRDQTAESIKEALIKVFSTMGMPETFHSDQGRNFESTLLKSTLEAFGIAKSRTTAYHPQGDGMVERLNRSLLQLMRTYVDREPADWERYLPLVLFAYRTAVHASTGISPFELMYGRQPQPQDFGTMRMFDPGSYQHHLQAKLAELRDFVESHIVEAAASQKQQYDQHTSERAFRVGDPVWLSVPTAGKLDPRWEGGWKVTTKKSPVTWEISDGRRVRVVHSNRLHFRHQPTFVAEEKDANDNNGVEEREHRWSPPQMEHMVVPETDAPTPVRRYPPRNRRPPDFYM